ncbi:hypothetical protein ABT301_11970 [Streptomyces sp. NPDC000987]|uniref:Rv1733c family protein n=1 Tax=Streptomyces sp. NPDC000987 TaxID=3154374 RepID=UPI003321D526
MRRTGDGNVVGWRWRHNPLRRRSDVLEAWILLVAWTAAVCAAVVAGVLGFRAMERLAERERADRLPVAAVVTGVLPGSGRDLFTGVRRDRVPATVRWTDREGRPHTGTTDVPGAARRGAGVRAWTDGRGHLVPAPVPAAEAATRAVLAGTGAAFVTGVTVLAGGYLVRLGVERRATDRWGTDWERADRRWGHTTG